MNSIRAEMETQRRRLLAAAENMIKEAKYLVQSIQDGREANSIVYDPHDTEVCQHLAALKALENALDASE